MVFGGKMTERSDDLIKLPDVDDFPMGSKTTEPTLRKIFEIVIGCVLGI